MGGKSIKDSLLQPTVEDLLLTSPLEIKNQIHIDTEADFIDFCETHDVPKSIELKSRQLKNEYINLILQELKLVKPMIKKISKSSEKIARPNPLTLDLERSLIHHLMGVEDWYHVVEKNKANTLVFLIDNSNSISFFRRLDIAKTLGLILKSFATKPRIKILLFAEKVKEFELKDNNLEEILKEYLTIKSAGFTDFSYALEKLETYQNTYKNSHGIIISDGVSSVGRKQKKLNFKPGKVHYLKIGNKKSPLDEILKEELEAKKGQIVTINSDLSLSKPIYQIIKRL